MRKKYDYKSKIKSELCKSYEKNGNCIYGVNCDFAHGISELKVKKNVNALYKTQICKNYKTNTCKFGERCHFLHVKENET